jgi:hypothetical protein
MPAPEWVLTGIAVLHLNNDREYYLVSPSVAQAYPAEMTPLNLYLARYTDGTPFLIPVPQLKEGDRKRSPWHTNLEEIVTIMGREHWIRSIPNMAASGYDCIVSEIDYAVPCLDPNLTMNDYVKIGFKNQVITDINHPALKQLLGKGL